MTRLDGRVIGKKKIVDNGDDWQRFNVVIMGDGYLESQMPRFEADAQAFVDFLLRTPPFYWLAPAINVHRIDVVSDEEGADEPTACGFSGLAPRTYFDARFCGYDIPRLLVVDQVTALEVATEQVRGHDAVVVIVNSTRFGGSGGSAAVFSRYKQEGEMGPEEIGLHELGHSAFNLADEYEYWRGCEEDPPGDQDDHPIDVEPEWENVTIDPSPDSLKWGDLVLRGTPLPTTRNPDCTHCDTQLNPVGADVVGAFEGAHYHHCRAYRPIFDCKMRTLGRPFCPVCQRVIERLLKPDVAYATPYAIASAHFPDTYLRMDATGVKTAPGGQVNCATEIGPWEQFFLRGPRTDGTYTIESKHFTRWLRMDGTGVTEPTGSGGGTVNCQGSIGRLTLLRIVPNVDGTVSFGSVAFPNVFLRMDGQGVTPPAGIGGVVNCQGTIAPWEKFRLMPLPR